MVKGKCSVSRLQMRDWVRKRETLPKGLGNKVRKIIPQKHEIQQKSHTFVYHCDNCFFPVKLYSFLVLHS